MNNLKINWKMIPGGLKLLGKFGKDHLSSILISFGLVGFGATLYFVAEAAPKADKAIKNRIEETRDEEYGEITDISLKEKVIISAPYYGKAFLAGMATIACNLYAHKVDLDKLSSLAAMYALTKGNLKELKDKIVETDGEKKLNELNHAISDDVRNHTKYDHIYQTGFGDTIFRDKYTGLIFKSSNMAVNDAITTLNSRLMTDGELDLEEFLYLLKVPSNLGCATHAVFRANTASDIIHSYQILDYGPMSESDPTPVCIINYEPFLCPTWDFDSRMNKYE